MSRFNNLADLDYTGQLYGDPLNSISRKYVPSNIKDVFKLVEELWIYMGTVRTALQRIVRYFVTELEISSDYDEEKRWDKLLNYSLNIDNKLSQIGDDFVAYGNSLTSAYIPFIRYLKCQKCQLLARSSQIDYQYSQLKFTATCPKCKRSGPFDVIDRKDPNPSNINVIRWSPHSIDIIHEPMSGESQYLWTPDSQIKEGISKGIRFIIDRTPMEVLKCVNDNVKLSLDQRLCFHLKIETLAGIPNKGWGIPPILSNFSKVWYVQMLHNFNEAVALDYLIPLRILTPPPMHSDPRQGIDPTRQIVGTSDFLAKVMDMVADRRKNPTNWYALPFPVQYGPIGGEGVNMLQSDILTSAVGGLLNDMGVPIDFHQGTLQLQSAPMALRQIEKMWEFLVSGLNRWVGWFTDVLALAVGWQQVDAKLQPVQFIDDIARKQLLLQLAMQGEIPKQVGYAPWGIDMREMYKLVREEEEWRNSEIQKMQKDIESQNMPISQLVSPAQPGMGPPPMGAPGVQPMQPASIEELSAQASDLANQLMSLDESTRTSQLIQIKRTNPTLHALVKQMLSDTRHQLNSQGGAMLRSQMFGV